MGQVIDVSFRMVNTILYFRSSESKKELGI